MSDWVELVPMVEFAYNNITTTATGYSPFYAKYRFHWNSGTSQLQIDTMPGSSKANRHWIMTIHDQYRDRLETTEKTIKKYANRDRAELPEYSKGDLVMLFRKNIRAHRSCEKVDRILHDHFEIKEVMSETPMDFNIQMKWKIPKGIHVSLLERFIQENQEVNHEYVLDAADPIESDDAYHLEHVMASVETKGKVYI
jgi:hypothetical protein